MAPCQLGWNCCGIPSQLASRTLVMMDTAHPIQVREGTPGAKIRMLRVHGWPEFPGLVVMGSGGSGACDCFAVLLSCLRPPVNNARWEFGRLGGEVRGRVGEGMGRMQSE